MQPGFYTLRFRLYQAGVLQDVKYVKFRIGPPPFVIVPELIPLEPLIPFEDPGLSTHELFYRGRTCGPSTIELDMRALDPEGASVILVFRLKDEAGGEGPPLAAPARGSGARQEGTSHQAPRATSARFDSPRRGEGRVRGETSRRKSPHAPRASLARFSSRPRVRASRIRLRMRRLLGVTSSSSSSRRYSMH